MKARRLRSQLFLSLLINLAVAAGVVAWSYAVPVSAPELFYGGMGNTVDSLSVIGRTGVATNVYDFFPLSFGSVADSLDLTISSASGGSGMGVITTDMINLSPFDAFTMAFQDPRTFALWISSLQFHAIPEPLSLLLLGFGLLVLAGWGRRYRRRKFQGPIPDVDSRRSRDN